MSKVLIKIGQVVEVEDEYSSNGADGLRIRALINDDSKKVDKKTKHEKAVNMTDIPWAFPLLPKTLQSVPKVGEGVLIIADSLGEFSEGQRYYIGPLISQPQYHSFCMPDEGTSLLQASVDLPLERYSKEPMTKGAFPNKDDVALVGRGMEDVTLKYDKDSNTSEVNLRAGIRKDPMVADNPNLIGNIIFNDTDPAYIQLKYKNGFASQQKYPCTSSVNIVADYINIISNHDYNVSDNIHNRETLINEDKYDETINKLHQVPKGDKLVELLTIMKGCIMHHVHPWAGMEQCGDWSGFIKKLEGYDIESILSDFVRVS